MRAREKRYGGMEALLFMRVSGFHTSKKVWNRYGTGVEEIISLLPK